MLVTLLFPGLISVSGNWVVIVSNPSPPPTPYYLGFSVLSYSTWEYWELPFLGLWYLWFWGGVVIPQTDPVHNLGVLEDSQLLLKEQVAVITSRGLHTASKRVD